MPVRTGTGFPAAVAAVAAVAVIAALAFTANAAQGHSLEELENDLVGREAYVEFVDRPAPGFTLSDAQARAVGLADFRGSVVVLIFLYTNCPDVCPLHSALLASLQDDVNRTPMRDLVQFISVTTDPERDTPEIMDAYGAALGLDARNWAFLTSGAGDADATRRLAEAYGLKFTPAGDGYQMHGVVTHLIDKSGNLRARYHGLKVDPGNILLYINALTNDTH